MKKFFIITLCAILAVFAIAGAAFGIHKYNAANTAAADTTEYEEVEEPVENTITPDAVDADYGISDSDPLKNLKLSLRVDVDYHMLQTVFTGYIAEMLDNSMPNRNEERCSAASKVGWGKSGYKMYDAFNFPYSTVEKGKTKYSEEDIQQMIEETREEIMRNPVMLDMLLQGMKEMKLTDGTSVYDLNADWVGDYLAMYDEYGVGAFVTYHTRYWERYGFELPHDGEDVDQWRALHPNAPDPTDDDLELIPLDESSTVVTSSTSAYGRQGRVTEKPVGAYKLYVTDYHILTAKRALTWLDRCAVIGVETYSTTKHYPLNSTQNANDVRTYLNTDKDYVDKQPALVFSVMTKDEKKQLLFGFNVYDMRLEIFERTAKPVQPEKNPTPKPQPTPVPGPTPTPTPTPTPVPVPTPTPTPDPTPTPTPTPDPTPDPTPQKDPKDDPVHNGNADKGGGEGQGETPKDPTPDPSKRDMEDAKGGEDHNQGHSDPGTVQPSTPDPGPGHSDNEGKEDDNDPSTVEHTDEKKQDYGEEDHNQRDAVTDDSGNTSNPDEQESGGEFEMPGI